MMVAAVSGADPQNPKTGSRDENPRRPPLLPSERDNGFSVPRRPKSRQVSSASSTSTRCPSPFFLFFQHFFLFFFPHSPFIFFLPLLLPVKHGRRPAHSTGHLLAWPPPLPTPSPPVILGRRPTASISRSPPRATFRASACVHGPPSLFNPAISGCRRPCLRLPHPAGGTADGSQK